MISSGRVAGLCAVNSFPFSLLRRTTTLAPWSAEDRAFNCFSVSVLSKTVFLFLSSCGPYLPVLFACPGYSHQCSANRLTANFSLRRGNFSYCAVKLFTFSLRPHRREVDKRALLGPLAAFIHFPFCVPAAVSPGGSLLSFFFLLESRFM
jgi:hypothetical protein